MLFFYGRDVKRQNFDGYLAQRPHLWVPLASSPVGGASNPMVL